MAEGGVTNWPYAFLDMTSWTSLLWYSGMLAVDIFYYLLWCAMSRLKERLHKRLTANALQNQLEQDDKLLTVGFLNNGGNDSSF